LLKNEYNYSFEYTGFDNYYKGDMKELIDKYYNLKIDEEEITAPDQTHLKLR
jgi:hypothetical protein